jgi:predicted Rossmann-fold nucleotide-binding protein
MLKLISGGQTGVDRAALDVALQLNIPCGGYCPKGRKSEDGRIPETYPLIETKTDNYAERTELNVKNSDATLILIDGSADRGTIFTLELCKRYDKPVIVVDLSSEAAGTDISKWLRQNNINTLNVAGNRESISPGIHTAAYECLMHHFKT